MDTLFFAVVNRGKANAVLRKARECGATGGTIFLGEGTIQSKLLEKMGLSEIHKEILMISASEELCDKLHETLSEAFMFSKKNKGIAFSIPFKHRQLQTPGQEKESSPTNVNPSYFCIITIVDKGRGKDCIKAARAVGVKGGTLIHGHGAGIPTDFYFPLVIEPQKDIVMIITTKDKVTPVREKISSELELEKIGNGIIFILPVIKTSGLFENRSEESRGVMP
jgi:nitrogen regulatory protein PII